MKPSFALDFRDGLVTLLHRTSRGWSQVGSTSFDAPDFVEALGYMRSTALGLSPRGITTKLIIPNEQVLYTEVLAPGPEPMKRRRQIRAALEGLTPYALDDVVYDWWGTGPQLQVAVLAKETLAEAEAFAQEHRFNPVSFVAVPENGTYLGEPFFGASALSATLLAQGEKVERDAEPVTVVARDFLRADPRQDTLPASMAEPSADAPAEAAEATTQPSEPGVAAEPAQPEPPLSEPESSEPASADVPAPDMPASDVPAPDASQALPPPAVEASADQRTDRSPEPATLAADLPRFDDPKAASVPASRFDRAPPARDATEPAVAPMAAPPPQSVPEAPMVVDVVAEAPLMADDDTPRAPAASIVAAFASRRTAATSATSAPTVANIVAAKTALLPDTRAPAVGPAPSQRPAVPRPTLAKPPAGPVAAGGKAGSAPARPAAAKPLKSVLNPASASGVQAAKRERTVVPMIAGADARDPDGKERAANRAAPKALTGLGSRTPAVRGKPRYLGLILTVLLLAMLVAVAIWSSSNLGTNDTTGTGAGTPAPGTQGTLATPALTEETKQASLPVADPAPLSAAPDLTTAQDEAAADGQTIAPADTGLGDATPADTPASATETTVASAAITPKVEPAPRTEVSTMGAVPAAQGNEAQVEIFLASADTPPKTSDPIALPALASGGDANPVAASPPPPFGTVYKFDAEGRIIPTPEGILTPEGVLLFAGKPSPVPPLRPADVAPVVTAQPTPDPAATAAAPDAAATGTSPALQAGPSAVTPLAQDPTLQGKRPQDRPADLQPANNQQGTATVLAPDARFASLRPQARPAEMTAAAQDPNADAGQASLAANGFAMATSLKPPARPAQLTDSVNEAVAEALNQPAPDQGDAQLASANVNPEAQAEPDIEAAAPSLPTNASVAKQATVKNALATNRVALLAVFGTPSTRFAMIRQANGKVKKVQIGDTVDGGRIAAITSNAVQYQKGGQIVTLSLPTG